MHLGVHGHITDKTGAGLLFEATPDGSYAVYDTRACLGAWLAVGGGWLHASDHGWLPIAMGGHTPPVLLAPHPAVPSAVPAEVVTNEPAWPLMVQWRDEVSAMHAMVGSARGAGCRMGGRGV